MAPMFVARCARAAVDRLKNVFYPAVKNRPMGEQIGPRVPRLKMVEIISIVYYYFVTGHYFWSLSASLPTTILYTRS